MLTPAQEKFAAGVVSGLSQSEAYRRAYPRSRKWKNETVWKRASELMANGEVSGRVSELSQKAATAHEVTVERVVKELARIAFGNKRAVMKWGPGGVTLLDSDGLTDDEAALVAEVQQTETPAGGSVKIKTHDKVKALELLGRYVGLFDADSKLEITHKGLPSRVELVAAPGVAPADKEGEP